MARHRAKDGAGELSALNWLRFGLAFLVLISHARQRLFLEHADLDEAELNPFVQTFYFFTALGRPSVVGFFVLSGYLITRRYFHHLKAGSLSPSAFLISRGVRLYTVLLPVLIASALLARFSPLTSHTSWASFFAHLFFLQVLPLPYFGGNTPLWSLGYEAWCYVVFCGSVSGIFQIRRENMVSGCAWLLCGVSPLLLFPIWTLHYLALWAIGGLLALYSERTDRSKSAARRSGGAFACLLTILGFLVTRLGLLPSLIGDYAVAVPLAFSLGFLTRETRRSTSREMTVQPETGSAQSSVWGARLAGFSYSLYLTHYPIVLLFQHFLGERHRPSVLSISRWGAVVLVCLGFSYVFSRLTERHTNAVRDWLSGKLHRQLRLAEIDRRL